MIVIYLIVSRQRFEQDLKDMHKKELEKYKSNTPQPIQEEKKLQGLVFTKNGKVVIEVFNPNIKEKLENKIFDIKDFK